MNTGHYNITCVTTIDEPFIKQWEELWANAENASPFNSYGWFLASKDVLKLTRYEIFACYKNDQLFAVLPLFFVKRFGIKTASSLGYRFVSTPFLMKTYEEELFKSFFGEILQKRNIYISKTDTKAVTILHKLFPKMFFSLASVNPYLDRQENPSLFLSTTNHKNARRSIKKLGEDLTFKMYDHKDDLVHYLQVMFEVEQKSEKKLHNMDLFSKKENRDFFINVIKYCSQFVRIDFLYYKDTPIAYTFNFLYKNVFFGYQTSYLAEYKKLYPGKIILVHDLGSLRETPFDLFNLGGGVSSYKLEFAPTYYFLYDIYYAKNSLYMWLWKTINVARRTKQVLFPIKHTRDHEFLFKPFQ